MDGIVLPHPLFQAIAGYLIPRMADPQAQGLYNGLVLAMASQPPAEEPERTDDPVDTPAAE